MKLGTLTALGCIGVLVAACGGGNGGGDLGSVAVPTPGAASPTPTAPTAPNVPTPTASTGIPASALASIGALVAYLQQLALDDASEPLALPDVALPTSESADPA